MTVNLSPVTNNQTTAFDKIGFDLSKPPTIPVAAAQVSQAEQAPQADKVEISAKEKAPKKGIVQKAKDFVRTAKKLGITISEYTKGTFVGVGQGFLVGSGVFTVGSIINGVKKLKINKAVKNGVEDAAKNIKMFPAKSLGVIGAALMLGISYWKTSLNANERKANVDHRYTPTPIKN